jgi:amino acid adenylation domain-containing protein
VSLAQRLANLSPEKRRLLERLTAPARIVPSTAIEAPASFEQERMWFLQQLEPLDSSYHLHMQLPLPATLDVAALQHAWQYLVQRHESLRTHFVERDGLPTQVIDPSAFAGIAVTDLSRLDSGPRRVEAARIARQQAETPFDLATGPLFRVALLRLPEQWVQLLTIHHIISDGWSIDVLMHELDIACAAFARRVGVPLPPLPVQFKDFARWQRSALDSARLDELLSFWTGYLHGAPTLQLPTDRPRAETFSHRAGVRSHLLAPALRTQLDELARREGTTLFQVFLAAFAVLLHRCTGQCDLVFGTPVAHRDTPEVEGLIGFFLNIILLRVRLSSGQGFRQVLAETRASSVDAYGAQQLPFARLVQHLQPERDLRRNPLYQATIQFLRSRHGSARTRAVLDEIGYESAQTNVDLALDLFEGGEGLLSRFEYSLDRFDDATIDRLLDQWERVLQAVVSAPDTPIGRLLLTTPHEHRLLIEEWAGVAEVPTAGWVFRGEGRQVAVYSERGTLDRSELDALCGRLAAVLMARGAVVGSIVALVLADPLETLIAILAAWRAGAAYVHIDPALPTERIAMLLDTVQPAVVLDAAPGWRQAMQTAEPASAPSTMPPDRAAAVIFTSGSTGAPKGVLIEHGALAQQAAWLRSALGVTSRDVVLQKYSFSFDAALSELLAGLACEATLVVAPDHGRDAERLVEQIVRHGVTLLDVVPSQLAVLLDQPGFAQCVSLRCVVAGGERLPAALVERLARTLPEIQLVNAYGPTEATITACAWFRPPASTQVPSEPALTDPPIGRPIGGNTAYVLDAAMQPVPVGMQGQLYLGGSGLARGYLRDDELTRQRFLPNPFSPGRLYATGDRVRFRCGRQLEYLGRLDQQIKLRGYRIEPEEIERALSVHPAVREACVALMPLPALPADEALRLQWRLEQLSPPEADFLYRFETDTDRIRSKTMWRKTPDFDLYLDIQTPTFLNTPLSSQRNWLLRRTLDEAVDDLQSLQRLEHRCVPGAARPAMVSDLSERPARYSAQQLLIDGQQVMQAWEAPLMRALAQAVAGARGDVAEIGFGMGISAGFVQALRPRSHTIVECHPDVLAALQRWRAGHVDADIRVAACRWQDWDVAPECFDGVLFDTYPTSEDEYTAEVTTAPTFAASFFATARRLLRPGGVFTYYTNEIDSLSRRHQRLLLEHFSSFSVSVTRELRPPPDCQYWWADSMVVVAAVK